MDSYVTGGMIRKLRESRGMTQLELAEMLCVSDKAVSKWETGKGYPDLSLLETLAAALKVSVLELLSGHYVTNSNRAFNMTRLNFYVCPLCGNVLWSIGEAVISCCGIALPPCEGETPDAAHPVVLESVEDELYVSIDHEMSKHHSLSFIASLRDNGCEIVKLYPEGNAEARFKRHRIQQIAFYCNHHGLFVLPVRLTSSTSSAKRKMD